MSRFRLEEHRPGLYFLMRGRFGMADIRQEAEGWSMSGYGWRVRKPCPSKLAAIKSAIRASRAVFMEAALVPVERLPGLPSLLSGLTDAQVEAVAAQAGGQEW